ncbi:hypothetical protein BJ508DRAFT_2998 [Ascobolus immersus RN42]|uniref:Uncharacterized protein n=1 Tax=Ascobolus immersus RN42 TaxID=1160509 RepID=A0A3N4ITT5_ASCIM|nr:hypothetical protein BJ508DRAFT_2998 [Ascobolus immersus RN42]
MSATFVPDEVTQVPVDGNDHSLGSLVSEFILAPNMIPMAAVDVYQSPHDSLSISAVAHQPMSPPIMPLGTHISRSLVGMHKELVLSPDLDWTAQHQFFQEARDYNANASINICRPFNDATQLPFDSANILLQNQSLLEAGVDLAGRIPIIPFQPAVHGHMTSPENADYGSTAFVQTYTSLPYGVSLASAIPDSFPAEGIPFENQQSYSSIQYQHHDPPPFAPRVLSAGTSFDCVGSAYQPNGYIHEEGSASTTWITPNGSFEDPREIMTVRTTAGMVPTPEVPTGSLGGPTHLFGYREAEQLVSRSLTQSDSLKIQRSILTSRAAVEKKNKSKRWQTLAEQSRTGSDRKKPRTKVSQVRSTKACVRCRMNKRSCSVEETCPGCHNFLQRIGADSSLLKYICFRHSLYDLRFSQVQWTMGTIPKRELFLRTADKQLQLMLAHAAEPAINMLVEEMMFSFTNGVTIAAFCDLLQTFIPDAMRHNASFRCSFDDLFGGWIESSALVIGNKKRKDPGRWSFMRFFDILTNLDQEQIVRQKTALEVNLVPACFTFCAFHSYISFTVRDPNNPLVTSGQSAELYLHTLFYIDSILLRLTDKWLNRVGQLGKEGMVNMLTLLRVWETRFNLAHRIYSLNPHPDGNFEAARLKGLEIAVSGIRTALVQRGNLEGV